jgi:hypothetical protein
LLRVANVLVVAVRTDFITTVNRVAAQPTNGLLVVRLREVELRDVHLLLVPFYEIAYRYETNRQQCHEKNRPGYHFLPRLRDRRAVREAQGAVEETTGALVNAAQQISTLEILAD